MAGLLPVLCLVCLIEFDNLFKQLKIAIHSVMKAYRLLLFVLLITSSGVSAQNYSAEHFGRQVFTLTRFLELNHYSPRIVDDKLSSEVFYEVLNRLDPDKMLFLKEDISSLSLYRDQLDEDMNGKPTKFSTILIGIYRNRVAKADSLVQSIMRKPFDFNIDESILLSRDSLDYAADEKQLASNWTKWLKYRTLVTLFGLRDQAASKAGGKTSADLESEARKRVLLKETTALRRISQNEDGFENYVGTVYCNAIATRFDPHSEYMPLKAKQEFEEELNGVELSVGIRLDENEKGEIVISQLVPGGPAWKGGELHRGDVLLQIALEGKAAIDLSGMDIDDANKVLEGTNDTRMNLTVRQVNGVTKTVRLMKEEVKDDENFVKSFVLKGDRKIGYISLPGFYSREESELGSSCANDVAKEVVKLKRENVEGLILDLRFNGGGSLKEALDMAGIFINEGPLVMVRDRTGKRAVIKDMNRGSIYDGPLILMVNSMSASASELLASVLQDYQRALVVGSKTYGKGTAQVILPVDTSSSPSVANQKEPEFGFIKVTVRKFYRVNGGTVQFSGVKPDIPLPDIYDVFKVRESDNRTALLPDTTEKIHYPILAPLPTAILNEQAQKRVNESGDFKRLVQLRDWLRKDLSSRRFSLRMDGFEKQYQERSSHYAQTDIRLTAAGKDYATNNNGFDKERLQASAERTAVNVVWLKNLNEDVYLDEAFHVLSDMLNVKAR